MDTIGEASVSSPRLVEENPFEIASDVVFSEKAQRRDDTMTYIGSCDDEASNNE